MPKASHRQRMKKRCPWKMHEQIVNNYKMKERHYHTSITVDATPQEAFNKINNVTKWWTEDLQGNTQNLDDEFTVRFGDVHVSTQKLVEFVPGEKVVWLVTKSKLNFIKQQDEWNNTKIAFELTQQDNKTQINFTHIGLVPEVECYNGCTKGWDYYIASLYKLFTEGKGTPGSKLE